MSALREWAFRTWYWYVNSIDQNGEILFMNYGYSDPASPVALDLRDEANRYSIQLYDLLARAVDLKGKDIAEVGCGRGGGLSYIARKYMPATALGVDLDRQAVSFCNQHYRLAGLAFQQGDAQQLNLKDGSFDALFNVESSHRYPRMELFLREVKRLLRPQGYFLFVDFRYDHEIAELNNQLLATGMKIIGEQSITANVVEALQADDSRKRTLVQKLAPRCLQTIALNFAGAVGSETYNQFASRKYEYRFYIVQKI